MAAGENSNSEMALPIFCSFLFILCPLIVAAGPFLTVAFVAVVNVSHRDEGQATKPEFVSIQPKEIFLLTGMVISRTHCTQLLLKYSVNNLQWECSISCMDGILSFASSS